MGRLLAISLTISITGPALAVQAKDMLVSKRSTWLSRRANVCFLMVPLMLSTRTAWYAALPQWCWCSQPWPGPRGRPKSKRCATPTEFQYRKSKSRRSHRIWAVCETRSRVCGARAPSRQHGSRWYQRGITFALRTIFPDGFYDSMLTVRFTSTFEMWSKQRDISR